MGCSSWGIGERDGEAMKPKTNRPAGEKESRGYDCCETPDYAIKPLLKYLYRNEIQKQWIWEPAAGTGRITRYLRRNEFSVFDTELTRGENFFDTEHNGFILTNPPWSIKYKWLERCYALDKRFALLMPVEVLGAAKAQRLFDTYGIEVVLLDKRVDFRMPVKGWGGQAQMPVAWFTNGLHIGAQITFETIDKRLNVCVNCCHSEAYLNVADELAGSPHVGVWECDACGKVIDLFAVPVKASRKKESK